MEPRPVALSLFPDLQPAKPFGRIPESVQTGSNADLLATAAPFYLQGMSVLDVTYGRGGWWTRYQPEHFRGHDLELDGVDFTALPYPADSWDVVAYDPPYVATGGPSTTEEGADFRDRYGIAPMRGNGAIAELIRAGLAEACRVARCWVLVKCMDFTSGGHFLLMHRQVMAWAEEEGWWTYDLVVHWTGAGIGGHNIWTPKRFRRAHSYLLVLAPRVKEAA